MQEELLIELNFTEPLNISLRSTTPRKQFWV